MTTISPALEEADARLFVFLCTALSRFPRRTSCIFEKLIPVALSNQLPFTSTTSLLRILLTYISPVSIGPNQIAIMADKLLSCENPQDQLEESDLIEDVEGLLLWMVQQFNLDENTPHLATIQIARDLNCTLAVQCKHLGFVWDASMPYSNDVLFSFVKAKTLQMSPFHHNLSDFDALYRLLAHYEPFNTWHEGIITPYCYFWKNYASVRNIEYSTNDFLQSLSIEEQFNLLVGPLDSVNTLGKMMETRAYLQNAVLPFLLYTGSGLQLLSSWISEKSHTADLNQSTKFWDEVIQSTLSFTGFDQKSFTQAEILKFVQAYVVSSINQTIFQEYNLSSINFVEAYSQMSSTTRHLINLFHADEVSPINILLKIDPIMMQNVAIMSDFLEIQNILLFLSKESALLALILLQELSDTCVALYPMCSLTFGRFLYLKGSSTPDNEIKEQELSKILSIIDETNYEKVLEGIDLFVSTFVGTDTLLAEEIDQLIIERFFLNNMFDLVLEYYQNKDKSFKMSPANILDLGIKKVWDLLRAASNIDDTIGRMKSFSECLDLLSAIAGDNCIDEEQRLIISKFKHFQKALSQLKNFKLVLERNTPVTPLQILRILYQQEDEEAPSAISLISLVLEQNPKSYLAHEKLYRISVDFSIFSGTESMENFLPIIQSACIESSLIDDNFPFAYKQSKAMFDHYVSRNEFEHLGKFWLTFYQVGKYILTDWFNDYDEKVNASKIDVLRKQKEILSLTLKLTRPSNSTVDNSRLIIAQLRHVNGEIRRWYVEDITQRAETTQRAAKSTQTQIQSNLKEIISDVSASRTQASEKLSNLLVSGIGWAIGANREGL